METISVFNHVTVDGFFAGPHGEIDWHRLIKEDDAWSAYTHHQAGSGGATLVFGRTTYEMMKSYWPTASARQADPQMADAVNLSPKIVFSKTLMSVEEEPHWKNARLLRDILPEEILRLKQRERMVILGSGTIVQQLTNLSLIDEYSLVVVPVVLGRGKSLFEDVNTTSLRLIEARHFNNGIALLRYQPAGASGGR